MPRYARMREADDPWPEADMAYDREFAPDLTVYESDKPTMVDSGLVDLDGNRLGRVIEREPIGFAFRV